MARDVEIAIREHDYAEAMLRLHKAMATRAGRRRLIAAIGLLLRPSVAIAAGIMDDSVALDELVELVHEVANANADAADLVVKAEANRVFLEMVVWLRATIAEEAPAAKESLEIGARSHGYPSLPQALRMLERHGELYEKDGLVHRGPKPPETSTADVPPFKQYMATREDLDAAQATFYEERFKPGFLRGERIELGDSISYGYVLFGEVASESGYEDLAYLRGLFLRACDFYSGTSLAGHAARWASDTFLLEENYQAAYDLLAADGLISLETYIGIADQLVDSRVTGQMAWDWTTSARLRPYGVKHKDAVLAEVERVLDEEHRARGRSIVLDLWDALAVQRAKEQAPPAWVTDLLGSIDSELHFMQLYGGRESPSFRGLIGPESPPIAWPSPDASGLATYSTYGFHLLVRDYLHGVFREAENTVRENAGMPRIGEGWVSEVDLYHRLRDAFTETRVIHQGRPRWLGQQSLDILFPAWKVAVEYQGEQHSRPVELFGGEAAFAAQQERDERKRRLCRENDHALIEVFPGYDIEEVLAQVTRTRAELQAHGSGALD
ncbi:hypothetical protein [Microbacterium sp.]|uniref:hypothetical protein n=1 Tax=Microbacterium sp. TaxID=51671 RepID=UPI0028120E54|nr:hypothetical protein [Microbacterium sp.]